MEVVTAVEVVTAGGIAEDIPSMTAMVAKVLKAHILLDMAQVTSMYPVVQISKD